MLYRVIGAIVLTAVAIASGCGEDFKPLMSDPSGAIGRGRLTGRWELSDKGSRLDGVRADVLVGGDVIGQAQIGEGSMKLDIEVPSDTAPKDVQIRFTDAKGDVLLEKRWEDLSNRDVWALQEQVFTGGINSQGHP